MLQIHLLTLKNKKVVKNQCNKKYIYIYIYIALLSSFQYIKKAHIQDKKYFNSYVSVSCDNSFKFSWIFVAVLITCTIRKNHRGRWYFFLCKRSKKKRTGNTLVVNEGHLPSYSTTLKRSISIVRSFVFSSTQTFAISKFPLLFVLCYFSF